MSTKKENIAPRHTQRLPKVCIQCANKKIKCDKTLPCNNCRKLGIAHLCSREVVIVKGKLYNENNLLRTVNADTNPLLIPYIYEIQRLEKELSSKDEKLKLYQNNQLQLNQIQTTSSSFPEFIKNVSEFNFDDPNIWNYPINPNSYNSNNNI